MRPYLAILKDSVREAVRSRTLPFLLGFFSLVLAGVAPLGLHDDTAWRMGERDVADLKLFGSQLRRDRERPGEQFGDRVLDRLPADVRAALLDPTGETKPQPRGELMANANLAPEELLLALLRPALNQDALSDPSLFDPADDRLRLRGEGRELARRAAAGTLPAELRPRLNRLALEAAFPFSIRPVPEMGVAVTYAGYEPEWLTDLFTGATGALTRENVERGVRNLYRFLAGWIAGTGGVLVGLLVTAALIPQTFASGAIDLLLSKPVNRSLTFLTKFVGGCVFVGLAAAYFTGGLFLIGGLRAGVWEPGMLLSGLGLTLTFAVIYSVSAAAGVLWRNPIVCVLAAGLVWAGSSGFQYAHGFITTRRDDASPRGVAAVGGRVFQADRDGAVAVWNPAGGEGGAGGWSPAFYQPNLPPLSFAHVYRLDGPTADHAGERLLAFERYASTPNGLPLAGDRRLRIGVAEDGWRGETGDPLPIGAEALFVAADGSLRIAGTGGLHRSPPPIGEDGDAEAADAGAGAAVGGGALGWLVERGLEAAGAAAERGRAPYLPIVMPPGGESWPQPFAAGYDPAADEFAVYLDGTVRAYSVPAAAPLAEARISDSTDPAPPALLTRAGGKTWIATADGTGFVADDAVAPWSAGGGAPRRMETAPDGARFLLLTHDGKLTIFDAANGESLAETDGVTAAAFDGDGGVLVGAGPDRVARLDGATLAETAAYAPPIGTFDRVYRWLLTPIHFLLPDTIALGRVTGLMFAAEESDVDDAPVDLRLERETTPIIGPLIHNLAFLAAMLALTCRHVARTDF